MKNDKWFALDSFDYKRNQTVKKIITKYDDTLLLTFQFYITIIIQAESSSISKSISCSSGWRSMISSAPSGSSSNANHT